MRYSRFMCIMTLTGFIGFMGLAQADAANDPLWFPTTSNEVTLNQGQENWIVQVPSNEAKEMIQKYSEWYKTRAARIVNLDEDGNVKEYSGQQFANDKFTNYVNVRTHFYEWTHRYDYYDYGKTEKQISYANEKLQQFRKDIKVATPATTYVDDVDYKAAKTDIERETARAAYNEKVRNFNPMVLLDIEERDMKDVEISEVRSYANEILLFSAQHTINHPDFKKMERNAKQVKYDVKDIKVEEQVKRESSTN